MEVKRFTKRGPKLTAQDIEKAEKLFGAKLPEDYKQFLLIINGGIPHPNDFQDDSVQVFYSLRAKRDYDSLVDSYHAIREDLPKGVIPIGCNDFGDQICLALKGKNRGKVFFWHHEGPSAEDNDTEFKDPDLIFIWQYLEPAEREELTRMGMTPDQRLDWPGHPDMTLIANSFTEFLDSLHHISDEKLDAMIEKAKRDNAASEGDQ